MGKMTRTAGASTFQPCPEGQFRAVLCDVLDLGWKEQVHEGVSKGMQPFIKLVWQVDELNDEGKPFLVFDRQMKVSFHEKATLTKRLQAWLTAKRLDSLLDAEADIEDQIGQSAYISIEQNTGSDGTMYANVATIMPLPRGMQPLAVEHYTRACLRDDWGEKQPEYSAWEPLPAGVVAPASPTPAAQPPAEPPAAVKPARFVPDAGETEGPPKRAPIAGPVGGAARMQASQREAVKALAKAAPLEDDEDPFADGG